MNQMKKYKYYLFTLILLFYSNSALSEEQVELPAPIKLFLSESDFFRSLDFKNENKVKDQLRNYYKQIYDGDLLNEMDQWIENGSLESEYFSSYYDVKLDLESLTIILKKPTNIVLKLDEKSCWDLDIVTPDLKNLVTEYKVDNISQNEFNSWSSKIEASGFCLMSEYIYHFSLKDTKNGLRIYKINKEISKSTIDLK